MSHGLTRGLLQASGNHILTDSRALSGELVVLLVCDACWSVMPPLSPCASYYCITACLFAVDCWVECCMPQVFYRVRAMRAYQVCNRWAHGMGNETPSRVATTANGSAGCYYVVVILQSGLSSTRQDAPAGPLHFAVRRPGSSTGTLRTCVHRHTLCGTTVTASCPCSGVGTLRACMHAQALLWGITVSACCLGSGVGTLRARMHAHVGCEPPRQRPGYPASSHAPHVGCEPHRQRPGYPVSSHAPQARCELPRQRRGYPASSQVPHDSIQPPRQRRGYPASSHAPHVRSEPPRQQCGYPASSHAPHVRCEPLRRQPGYPASLHARAGPAVRHHCDPGAAKCSLRSHTKLQISADSSRIARVTCLW